MLPTLPGHPTHQQSAVHKILIVAVFLTASRNLPAFGSILLAPLRQFSQICPTLIFQLFFLLNLATSPLFCTITNPTKCPQKYSLEKSVSLFAVLTMYTYTGARGAKHEWTSSVNMVGNISYLDIRVFRPLPMASRSPYYRPLLSNLLFSCTFHLPIYRSPSQPLRHSHRTATSPLITPINLHWLLCAQHRDPSCGAFASTLARCRTVSRRWNMRTGGIDWGRLNHWLLRVAIWMTEKSQLINTVRFKFSSLILQRILQLQSLATEIHSFRAHTTSHILNKPFCHFELNVACKRSPDFMRHVVTMNHDGGGSCGQRASVQNPDQLTRQIM
ncbi:hypothetical protein PAXRUDRAFT_226560, partial [Paxillus rubicundulus Ve08.2h10]